ncbi:MAG: XdhC family protein [Oscillospiraceae bacterium]|nr:XdhC family protein [Oscillospiraceae bacterium]
MKKLMESVARWLNQGEDVILATIIADSGSAPRGAGARMAIIGDGSFVGTIGGGAVEFRVQQMAVQALKDKKSLIKSFTLSPNDKEDLGMICGGNVVVFIQYIPASDYNAGELFAYGFDLFTENVDSWLITDITDETDWHMTIFSEGGTIGGPLPDDILNSAFLSNNRQFEHNGRKYYSEYLSKAERVYVFGGGHISQELVPVLSHIGFSCFVFDNLPKFANRELFPSAQGVTLGDFDNISGFVDITEKDYVVIMTRGHSFDFSVQAQALKKNPRYIGVIGSRSKIAAVSQKLGEMGFSQEEISKIHSPIGIAIKADTPAEIAVSIAAELIMIRAEAR